MDIFMLSEGGPNYHYGLPPLGGGSSNPQPPKKDDDSIVPLIVLLVIAFLAGVWFSIVVTQ